MKAYYQSTSKHVLFLLMSLVLMVQPGTAKPLNIEVTTGKIVVPRVAVVDFKSDGSKQAKEVAKVVTSIIRGNLGNCGVFSVVPKIAFIQDLLQYNQVTDFTDWQAIDVKILVDGAIEYSSSKKQINVKFAVYDVVLQEMVISKMFTGKLALKRTMAHRISDNIYQTFTGDQALFSRKITCVQHYISNKDEKLQRVIVADQDGYKDSIKLITDGKSLVTNPVFSRDNKKLVYLSWPKSNSKSQKLTNKNAKIIRTRDFGAAVLNIHDIARNRVKKIKNLARAGEFAFSPSFSKDGRYMLLAITNEDNSHIFEYDMKKDSFRQITSGPYLDTSPVFTHEEDKVFFVSNRCGRPNIYAVSRNGTKMHRLTFGPGAYYCPTCSPDGKHLGFVKAMNHSFYIGCMEMEQGYVADEERLIARAYIIDSLRWVTNNIMSFSYTPFNNKNLTNISKLATIDVSGHRWRTLEIPDSIYLTSPMWSNIQ